MCIIYIHIYLEVIGILNYKGVIFMNNIDSTLRYKILLLLTCYAIAKQLKIPQSIIYKINKENSIRNTKVTSKHYEQLGKDKTEEVIDYLTHSNLSYSDISKIFNVSATYVSRINKKYNIRE